MAGLRSMRGSTGGTWRAACIVRSVAGANGPGAGAHQCLLVVVSACGNQADTGLHGIIDPHLIDWNLATLSGMLLASAPASLQGWRQCGRIRLVNPQISTDQGRRFARSAMAAVESS